MIEINMHMKLIERKCSWLCLLPVLLILVSSCAQQATKLPYLGNHRKVTKEVDGQEVVETLYHTVEHFEFYDQDSVLVKPKTFEGKVFVADFFFTSCTSICPIMKSQMKRVYDAFESNGEVAFLSHSIDPEYDDVARLHDFAGRLGVDASKWHFVTGNKDSIYEHANQSYMVFAAENALAQDGIEHSGAFLLVDKDLRIRGVYDGTVPEEVDRLINEIPVLLGEYED